MPRLDRYQDPAVYERIAGAYVLGTLRGRARERLAQLAEERPYIRQAVEDWQRRLDPLAVRLTPVEPPHRVWPMIAREIRTAGRKPKPASGGFWGSLTLWRTATVAALGLAMVLGLDLLRQPAPTPPPVAVAPERITVMPDRIAVLESEDEQPMLVATASREARRLHVMAMEPPDLAPDQDWELWAIPSGGGAPVSLGVLSHGKETVLTPDPHGWEMVTRANAFAVSLEPRGGSPTGAPTAVMYSGPALEI